MIAKPSFRNRAKKNLLYKIFVLAVLALPLLLTGCQNSDNSDAFSGIVEADRYDVIAESSGRVVEVLIQEGDKAGSGDIIARMDDEAQKIAVQQAETLVELSGLKLEGLKAGPTDAQLKQAESAAGAARASVNAAKSTVEYWDDTVESLKINPLPPPNDLANAEYQLKLAKNKQSAAQWGYTAAKSAYNELKQSAIDAALLEPPQSPAGRAIRAAEEELKQAQAQLDMAGLNLSRCEVKARVDGICTYLGVQKGDMCVLGSRAAQITDYSSLWVNIYIPQSRLLFIKLGQELPVRSIAWPDKNITGKVVFISDSAEFTPKNVETPEEKQSTVFKAKIAITKGSEYAKPGMSVDVIIPSK
ncbi:MAG: efflux RND transporter periplasmic adaptor subunit [Bacillota bacterium]|nr:efflux RND transporter periplasmic adaptor subunit [Bacillota bacterium]